MSERLWQHDKTGRMVWHENPGRRWHVVPTMHEDELPEDMSDEAYIEWFAQSTVPDGVGCRVGPVVKRRYDE